MSKSNFTRRGVIKTGAIGGAAMTLPTYLRAQDSGFTNAPVQAKSRWASTYRKPVLTRMRAPTSCAPMSWLLSTSTVAATAVC